MTTPDTGHPYERLTPDLLPPEVLSGPTAPEVSDDGLPYREAVLAFKRRLIRGALQKTDGNQTKAAENLGLQRSYLNRLIKDLDLGS